MRTRRRTRKKSRKAGTISLVRKVAKDRNESLLSTVRALAIKQQTAEPQLFASLRDAATQFDVAVSTMAAVYRQLTKEHLLIPIRGSRTLLAARGRLRTLQVRGIIGIPVSVRRFATLPEYRHCFLRLRDELLRRGFAAQGIFLEQRELEEDAAIRRLKELKAESALWFVPDGADSDTPLRLRDNGIQFVGVNLAELTGLPCRYQVRRSEALRAVLRSWKQRGLKGVVISRTVDEAPPDAERVARLRTLAQSEGFEVEIITSPTGRTREVTREMCAERCFGLFLPGPAAALLARFAPEVVHQVVETCRVALIDGPIDLPVTREIANLRADIISVDWAAIAARVAHDIDRAEVENAKEAVVFSANPRMSVPLARYR